jgi:hypothetical protein
MGKITPVGGSSKGECDFAVLTGGVTPVTCGWMMLGVSGLFSVDGLEILADKASRVLFLWSFWPN